MYFSLFFLQKLYRVGFLILLILIFLDLIAFFYFPQSLLGELFIATKEQTPLTWLSSLAMLFLGLASLSVYYQSAEKLWYFLGGVFFFFSVDDATYLHERIAGSLQGDIAFFGTFPSYIWVLLYMPLLLFSLGTLLYLLWRKKIQELRIFVTAALFCLAVALFLDFIDGIVQKDPSIVFCMVEKCHLIMVHSMRLVEEVLEVFSLGLIGYALIKQFCVHTPGLLVKAERG